MNYKKENQLIEFKSDWRNEHLKIISAFANGDGGELLIGLDDKGKPVGLKNSAKLLEDIPNRIRNKLGIIPSVKLEKDKNKEIMRIGISPSQELPEPDFFEEYGVMKVVFYKDKFTEENLRKMGLNKRQIKAVMYVKEKRKITNETYQKICNIKKRQSSIDLKKLETEKILEKIGTTGRGTYYILKGQKRGKRGTKEAKKG